MRHGPPGHRLGGARLWRQTRKRVLQRNRARLLDYDDSPVTDPYYFQDQGPGHTVSAWFYWAGGTPCAIPFDAISTAGFSRGFWLLRQWVAQLCGATSSAAPPCPSARTHVAGGVRNMTGYVWIDGVQVLNLTTGYQYDPRNGWAHRGRMRLVDKSSVVQCDADIYVRALRTYDRLLSPSEVVALRGRVGERVDDTGLAVRHARPDAERQPAVALDIRQQFAERDLGPGGTGTDQRDAIGANGVYCGSPRAAVPTFTATPLAYGVMRGRVAQAEPLHHHLVQPGPHCRAFCAA